MKFDVERGIETVNNSKYDCEERTLDFIYSKSVNDGV